MPFWVEFLSLLHLHHTLSVGSHPHKSFPAPSCSLSSAVTWDGAHTNSPCAAPCPHIHTATISPSLRALLIAQPSSGWWHRASLSLPSWDRTSCCAATCVLARMLGAQTSDGSSTGPLALCTTTKMERTWSRWRSIKGGQNCSGMVSLMETWICASLL